MLPFPLNCTHLINVSLQLALLLDLQQAAAVTVGVRRTLDTSPSLGDGDLVWDRVLPFVQTQQSTPQSIEPHVTTQ
jgi:hypothetical protein